MSKQLLEITHDSAYLCYTRGLLLVQVEQETVLKTPLDALECVFVTGYGSAFSGALLRRLCELGIPLLILGKNFHPLGLLNTYGEHNVFAERLFCQISASLPLKKNLWQHIIKNKIDNQGWNLQHYKGKGLDRFKTLSKSVTSGDSKNHEGTAAQLYWPQLMGSKFRRGDGGLKNAMLNYGYAIVRATIARALMAVGLIPALGIYHRNKRNAFCLVDDLMEPLRPTVDALVLKYLHKNPELHQNKDTVDPTEKKYLVENLLKKRWFVNGQWRFLSHWIETYCYSLVQSYQAKQPQLLVWDAKENEHTQPV